jgi:hypothetical protein
MRLARRSFALILLGLICTSLNAQTQFQPRTSITNPPDLNFEARLLSDSHEFHMGQAIEIEIYYSSDAEKKYQTSRSNPSPELGGVAPHIFPSANVTNLLDLRRDLITGFAGSFLSGGPEFLTAKPITERLDLSYWYRFQKPGHYSVIVTSDVVWKMKTSEEGDGRQNLRLESNAVEFEILPPDPAWELAELANITQVIDATSNPGDRYVAIHRLDALDTRDAVNKLIDLFISNPSDDSEGFAVYGALRESSRTEMIIPRLQMALSDPSVTVPPQMAGLLALMQTRAELGMLVQPPANSAEQSVWEQKLKDRMKVRDKYLALANMRLLASIQLRMGPQRAQAIYQAWNDAMQLNYTSPQPAESLSQLRQQLFNVERELTPSQQLQLVTSSLQSEPHERLLPIIRDLTCSSGPDASSFVHSAFQLWCNEQPAECSAEIFRRASESDPLISQHIIYLMPEAERPEINGMLQEQLANPKFVWGGASSVNLSALVLRAGSKALVPTIDFTLDLYAKERKFECEPQAHLLGYLFRFAPKDATLRLSTIIEASADPCGNQMLRFLDLARYSDDLIPIAIASLNSPNLSAVGLSATFLGTHAAESAKAALWQRLDALRHDWRERTAELQSNSFSWGNSPPELAARLEQALTSAIANATNWKLSESERARLREGCLTDQCRNIADGKMRMGM